ncbi:Uma2 family endonuclease [Craurococcus roseus]|uniref:Uma2 family endonuclease n=1 Tax=Craurococcus roseus TaxID=77585 RepID=A0ABP3Q5S3_9PROT
MSASLKPLTLDEFLAWERTQPVRYEFDGTQPVAMTGGTIAADRVARRLLRALDGRLKPPCEAFGENVKVLTPTGRVRYPDVKVACGDFDPTDDRVDPVVVFEVLSPTTEMTDRRVKSAEYASIPSVMAYVLLAQDRPAATVLRRASGWEPEEIEGAEAVFDLPEIGVAFRLTELHADAGGV